MKNLKIRLPVYFVGLFIMTIGVALSVKSNLRVSPVSTIPYTMTCVWGIEMGNATIIFHGILVLIQLLILRKDFSPLIFLQIPVGIVFGKFTTLCNYLVSFLPEIQNIPFRLMMIAASCFLVALGIFFVCSRKYCSSCRRRLHGSDFANYRNCIFESKSFV